MAGTLSIVSTPIGHLEDITLRALNVLRSVNVVAAEDTRRTGHLLAHFGISTKTISFHEHNTRSRLPVLIERLKAGESIALVSDAGTPVLSDPGLELVQACVYEGIAVDPVPGASAPLTLAVASGFSFSPWTIFGFPPTRSSDRKKWFVEMTGIRHSVSFLEAPHRILRTIEDLSLICGERQIVVGRELTKLHQSLYRGTVLSMKSANIEPRGEFTVMLGPSIQAVQSDKLRPSDRQLIIEFGDITESLALGRREALKALADRHGMSARDVYAAVERAKQTGA